MSDNELIPGRSPPWRVAPRTLLDVSCLTAIWTSPMIYSEISLIL
jgi:hypothetical protein